LLVFLLVCAVGVGVCYFFGDLILLVLFGKPYLPAAPLLFVISIVVGLRMISTLPQSLLFAEQRYKEFLSFQLASLALAIALGCYLIPQYGVLGAGYVLLAVALFRLVILELIVMLFPRRKPKDATVSSKDDQSQLL
jgi:O-antigen/teichoic acid export membrane protein